MADFIKKKIVEVLAKFTKDLKPDDISLNFLRGKGELRNLELNAELINEVLRLPPWIAVSKVHCDSIRVSVPFTDLHRSPIHAVLGKVVILVKTCGVEEEDRDAVKAGLKDKLKMKQSGGSYGLVDKIIDGMKVEIRTILVHFDNPIFEGRIEISDVLFQSTTPQWEPAALSLCRYKNEDEGSIIIYKKCTWTSLKIEGWEVDATKEKNERSQLRLITSDTEIHIALKRSLKDCHVMHMRVSIHLGDIVWVLTQSQLKAASMLAQSLLEAALKWAQHEREEQNRWRGSQESVDSVGGASIGYPEDDRGEEKARRPRSGKKSLKDQMKSARLVQLEVEYQQGRQSLPAYEVIQDSFHIKTGTVNLQLCDDRGSLLVELRDLIVDIYPDQPAMSGRCHWHRSNSKLEENVQWSSELVKLASKVQHMDLPSVSTYKLRERGFVVRCSHFEIRSIGDTDLPIITSDKETFKIPDVADNPAFQCGLTMYYYTADQAHRFLVPRPNLFINTCPIHVSFHQQHCLWLVEFIHGVLRTVNLDLALAVFSETHTFLETIKSRRAEVKQLPGIDIELSIPYSKVTLPLEASYSDGRPRALQLETSCIHLQNKTLVTLFDSQFFLSAWDDITTSWLLSSSSQFPHSEGDPTAIPDLIRELIGREIKARKSNPASSTGPQYRNSPDWERKRRRERGGPGDKKTFSKMSLEQLKLSTLECWHAATDCMSVSLADDLTHRATLYTTELIKDFPLVLWLFQPSKIAKILEVTTPTELPALHLLVHAPKPLYVQLEHLHFLFLMRLKDSFQIFKTRLMDFLSLDSFISSQSEEAFQTHLNEDEDTETEGDSSDGRDLKERITAAFAQLGRTENDQEDEDEATTDGEKKQADTPVLTVAAAVKRLEVRVKLPSVLETHRNRHLKATPPPPRQPDAQSIPRASTSPRQPDAQPIPRASTSPRQPDAQPIPRASTSPSIHSESPSPIPSSLPNSSSLSTPALSASVSLPQLGGDRQPIHLKHGGHSATALRSLSHVSSQDELSEEFLLVNVPSPTPSSSSSGTYSISEGIALKNIERHPEQDSVSLPEEGLDATLIAQEEPDTLSPLPPSPPAIEVTPARPSSITSSSIAPPSPSPTPPEVLPILIASVGGAKVLVSLSAAGIQVRAAVDCVAINELTEEQLTENKDFSAELKPQECPVIKARFELGKKVYLYFPDEDWEPDSVVFLKVAGIRSTLSIKTAMALKDFFDDEVEAASPMPIQLRILETNFLLRDTLFSDLSCPRNLTVNVPDLFLNRGPRAQGTNLVQLSSSSVGGAAPSETVAVTTNDTEKALMESFRKFIHAFHDHLSCSGEEASRPEQISQLLHQLQDGLGSPPSYTEAISCNFYSKLTKPHQTVASMEAEMERLQRENSQLKEDFKNVSLQYTNSQEETVDVTRQLVDAKVSLASAHLVLERQKMKVESLSNEKMNLEEKLRLRAPSPL